MNSSYVTYEWSRALGLFIPVLGIQVGKIKRGTTIHPVLGAYQFAVCKSANIPNDIKDRIVAKLREYERESPLSRYVEWEIGQELMPLRILTTGLVWIAQHMSHDRVSIEHFLVIRRYVKGEAYQAYRKLPRYWLEYSHAFTSELKRLYDKNLLDETHNLRKDTSGWKEDSDIQPQLNDTIAASEKYLDTVQQIVRAAEGHFGMTDLETFSAYLSAFSPDYVPSDSDTLGRMSKWMGEQNGESIARYYLPEQTAEEFLKVIDRVAQETKKALNDDELEWDAQFAKTPQATMDAIAKHVRQQIADGLAEPLDYDKL
jgi:thioredoxin-related protein